MLEPCEISVCVDCAMLLANDDDSAIDPARVPIMWEIISENWAGYRLVPGDSETCFSRQPCDTCNDERGGHRMAFFAVKEEG